MKQKFCLVFIEIHARQFCLLLARGVSQLGVRNGCLLRVPPMIKKEYVLVGGGGVCAAYNYDVRTCREIETANDSSSAAMRAVDSALAARNSPSKADISTIILAFSAS
jgi:hypothetical protein